MNKETFTQLQSDDALVLDIREAEELADMPSPAGAVHIPMGQVFVEAAKGNLPKDKKIISLCRTGGRCQVLTEELQKQGFEADYLEGGLVSLEED